MAAIIISSQLYAQDSATVKQLDEVIVTANRVEQKQSSTGKMITVINQETLQEVADFGPVLARSVFDFFASEKTAELLSKMAEYGVRLKIVREEKIGDTFLGKVLVLTGTLAHFTRTETKEKIISLGGKVSGSVSQHTDYVLAGAEPGSKYDEAKKLGVKIISEAEFERLIKG